MWCNSPACASCCCCSFASLESLNGVLLLLLELSSLSRSDSVESFASSDLSSGALANGPTYPPVE